VILVRTVSLVFVLLLDPFTPALTPVISPARFPLTPALAPKLWLELFVLSCTDATFKSPPISRFVAWVAWIFAPAMFVSFLVLRFMFFALSVEFVWVVELLQS
jgi:hypothetical protein